MVGFGEVGDLHGGSVEDQFPAAQTQRDGGEVEGVGDWPALEEVPVSRRAAFAGGDPPVDRAALGFAWVREATEAARKDSWPVR
jgi:hypothetical protein